MKIFITRELASGSLFSRVLEAQGCRVEGCSLLTFSPEPFLEIPESDWIFFYSKQGARFFYEGLRAAGLPEPQAKIAALGPGTDRYLSTLGIQTAFAGSGKPQEVAQSFLRFARGSRVLFPRAAISVQSVRHQMDDRITALDLIVYKNEIAPDAEPPDADLYVFTSPLNAEAFFQKVPNPLQKLENRQVVAIGASTAGRLSALGFRKAHLPASPVEADLAACVLSLKGSR